MSVSLCYYVSENTFVVGQNLEFLKVSLLRLKTIIIIMSEVTCQKISILAAARSHGKKPVGASVDTTVVDQ